MKAHLLLPLALALTSCHVSSRVAMNGEGGRTAYNTTIQETTNEQMLLNIVRLRYFDSPLFLDVSTVTSQFTYRSSLSPTIKIPGFNEDNPASVNAGFSWQNQPTIQYSPLEGKAFATQLMQPINLKTLQQLIFTGWDIDRLFRLVVQNINDVPNAPLAAVPVNDSPVEFEKFYEITSLFRYFQLKMQLHIGLTNMDDENTSAKEVLQISFPKGTPQAEKLAKLLGSKAYILDEKYVSTLELGFDEHGQIGILPRSLLGAMYYASLGVEVPLAEVKKGNVLCALPSTDVNSEYDYDLGSLLKIRCSYRVPDNTYVKVHYKGKWFYIADSDMHSKKTFVLLQQLYNLQSIDIKQQAPILSIPLGGR